MPARIVRERGVGSRTGTRIARERGVGSRTGSASDQEARTPVCLVVADAADQWLRR